MDDYMFERLPEDLAFTQREREREGRKEVKKGIK